jgi:hypothetical protein
MIAWGGLGIPATLTEEQKKAIKGDASSVIPPDIPEGLMKYLAWQAEMFDNCMERNGYDPTLHFCLSYSSPGLALTE